MTTVILPVPMMLTQVTVKPHSKQQLMACPLVITAPAIDKQKLPFISGIERKQTFIGLAAFKAMT